MFTDVWIHGKIKEVKNCYQKRYSGDLWEGGCTEW